MDAGCFVVGLIGAGLFCGSFLVGWKIGEWMGL